MKILFLVGFILFTVLSTVYATVSLMPLAPGQVQGHYPVIPISRALHLNAKKEFIADITAQVRAKDNVWAAIPDGDYVRVTYEQVLDRHYDNAIYAKPNTSIPGVVEVYPVYTDKNGKQVELPRIATFSTFKSEGFYKILLTNLMVPTKTFDFKVISGVDIDYIVDPTFLDLHDFGGSSTDGEYSLGSLTLSGSTYYGMTSAGGASNEGMIFAIATTGGTLTDLHDFSGSATDGSTPLGSLSLSGSTLFGMTPSGGASNDGIIFSMATTGGTLTDLHDFSGSATDGSNPLGSLTLSGGTLYGMAELGGASNNGIIFSIATTGGALTDLHDFSGSATDGAYPTYGALTLSGTTLYGMTNNGGAHSVGIIFSMATTGGTLTDLHDFSGSATDGLSPLGSLTLSGSTLYGMTDQGGASHDGIIFSIATTGGSLTDLHDFSGSATDGQAPHGDLTLSSSFSYVRSITVQSSQISGGADLTQFPILVCGNASSGACNAAVSNMATVANGGHVRNSSGYDIIFASDSACQNPLTWEMENYNASTGEFEAWVTNTSTPLSYNSNTTFYMCYGNSAISTFQSTASSVWDSNYLGVWHMADNAANTTVADSTSNGNNGAAARNTSNLYTTGASCEFGPCASQNGSSDKVTIPSEVPSSPTTITLEGWRNYTYPGCFTCEAGIITSGSNGSSYQLYYENDTGGYQILSGVYIFPSEVGAAYTLAMIPTGWHYVVGTYDGSGWHVYWDGTLQASDTTSSGPSSGGGTTVFNNTTVSGYLGETRISNTARSAGWIATEYNNQSAPSSFYTMGSETTATLFGMTQSGGASHDGIIFSIAITGGSLTDLHDFSGSATDGQAPHGDLALLGNTLYGMTEDGGVAGGGIILSIATTGGSLTDLHDFTGGATTEGAIPYGSFTLSGSILYGMTRDGGIYGDGMIFSIQTNGGNLEDLHDFSGSTTDGAASLSDLTLSGSTLYGMTSQGGASNDGIIFSIATTGGTLTDLHDFSGSSTDGTFPFGSLTLSGSMLYGMAELGGASNGGIIFSIATTGGPLTDLHDFSGSSTDGVNPIGSLIISGSTLYGMTPNGGASDEGIIFSIATTGGVLTDLHDFTGGATDGKFPKGNLTISGSTLYGMTLDGGASNRGIIFSIATTSGSLTDLHDFGFVAPNGLNPEGSLTLSGSTLYGMTSNGGASGHGIIFSIATTGGTLTDLHDFSGSSTDGSDPYGSLIKQ